MVELAGSGRTVEVLVIVVVSVFIVVDPPMVTVEVLVTTAATVLVVVNMDVHVTCPYHSTAALSLGC